MPHAHEGEIWPEMEEDHGREQDFGQYDNYPEIYQDDLREECEGSHYGYNERPFEDSQEDPPYRGEDLMPKNRQWYDDRECTNSQNCRNQGTVLSRSYFSLQWHYIVKQVSYENIEYYKLEAAFFLDLPPNSQI